MKLSNAIQQACKKVIVYGAAKSGKTQLVGELSKQFNLIWIDCEGGYTTLFKLPKEQQERIELIALPDSRGFPVAGETILKLFTGQPTTVCQEHGKVKCPLCAKESKPVTEVHLAASPVDTIVVVDSVTQFSNSLMAHIMRGRDDDAKSEWEDFRKQGLLLDRFFSSVQTAKFNVVCITHETEVEQEDSKKKLCPTAGTTNFSRNVARYFDAVVYCEIKNKKHLAASSTTYANNILTGSRQDIALEDKAAPTLIDIFQHRVQVGNTAATPAAAALSNLKGMIAK